MGKDLQWLPQKFETWLSNHKESAKEVNHLIKSIQQDTQDTVNVMRKGQQKAVEGKEAAHKGESNLLVYYERY